MYQLCGVYSDSYGLAVRLLYWHSFSNTQRFPNHSFVRTTTTTTDTAAAAAAATYATATATAATATTTAAAAAAAINNFSHLQAAS